MKVTAKSQFKSRIMLILSVVFMAVLGLFTFAACKLTSGSSTINPSYDADGHLRLYAPSLEYYPYDREAYLTSEAKNISSDSGSFYWPLQYYYASADSMEEDQIGYLKNFFLDSRFNEPYVRGSKKMPIYATSRSEVIDYFYGDSAPANVTWDCVFDGRGHFYADTSSSGENKISTVYSKSEYVLNGRSVSFPDYEVVIDGKYYTFRVVLNENPRVDYDIDRASNPFVDQTAVENEDGRLFSFYYRSGRIQGDVSDGFIECPKGMMTYFTDSRTGNFMIKFNPMLEGGGTNRYLKVKALSKDTNRGDSLYSNTIAFNAYTLTFEAYSPNSIDLNYGGLLYDEGSFYFHTVKRMVDSVSNTEYNSMLIGSFPEGRQVIVSRESRTVKSFDSNGQKVYNAFNDYDYAFQPWTLNAKAENTAVIKETMPKNMYSNDYNIFQNYDSVTKEGLSCIPEALKTNSSAFGSVTYLMYGLSDDFPADFAYKAGYYKPEESTALSQYVKEYIYGVNNIGELAEVNSNDALYLRSDLVVTSSTRLAGSKLYANHAKVRNYSLSGTIFDSQNFFGAGNQYLTGFDIIVYNKNNEILCQISQSSTSSVTDTAKGTYSGNNLMVEQDRNRSITISIEGSQFSVSGLECGDFIAFEKLGKTDGFGFENISVPYTFHSAVMREKSLNGNIKKCLTVMDNETVYTDRQNSGIIATLIEEESNLVVNVYGIDENGETCLKDENDNATYLNLLKQLGISYEVIRSVTSVVDDNGYVTTNVIISIQLPANCSLVGYNVETLSQNTFEFYSSLTGEQYVAKMLYDANTFSYTRSNFYRFTTSAYNGNVKRTVDGQQIEITRGGRTEFYNYTRTAKVGGNTIMYYNKFDETDERTYEVLAYNLSSSNNDVTIITYTMVNDDDVLVSGNTQTGEEEIFINGVKVDPVNNSNNPAVDHEMRNVSAIATVYGTAMTYKNPDGDGEQNVYVYYDIVTTTSGDKYFKSPLGKKTTIEGEDGDTTFVDEHFYPEITNFDDLVRQRSIMLGRDILKSSEEKAIVFRDAMGSSIISSCYYYIEKLGEEVEVLVSQYIQSITANEETQSVVLWYKTANGKLKRWGGFAGTNTGDLQDNNGRSVFMSMLTASVGGQVVDSGLKVKTNTLYAASGLVSYGFNSDITNPANYKNTCEVQEIEDGENNILHIAIAKFVQVENKYNMKFLFKYYEPQYSDGNWSYQVYDMVHADLGNGFGYYKVVNSISVGVDADGNYTNDPEQVVNTVAAFVLDTEKYEFSFNVDNTLASRFVITGIKKNGAALPDTAIRQTYSQYEYSSERIVSTTKYNYLNYLIPSIQIREDEEQSAVDLYFGVTLDNKVVVPNIELSYNKAYRYYANFTPSEDGEGSTEPPTSYPNGQRIVDSNGNLLDPDGDIIQDPNGNNVRPQSGLATNLFELVASIETISVPRYANQLIRMAKLITTNDDVTVLGKYFLETGTNDPVVYPTFSSYNKYSEEDSYILTHGLGEDADFKYYSLDYTSRQLVVEGMPGFKLLAGMPYPNPILFFSIRHKYGEDAIVNISFDIKDAFYAELLGTNIAPEDSNQVRDFCTYAFKDTLLNLTLNDYINKTYWILDNKTFKPIVGYVQFDSRPAGVSDDMCFYYNGKYYVPYTTLNNELTIQDVGINDGDSYLYFADVISPSDKYLNKVYRSYIDERGNMAFKEINYEEELILWRTDSTKIEQVPVYDVHTYYEGQDGILYFTSGSENLDENQVCNGLEGLTPGITQSDNGVFNYDEVMLGGVAYAYRTKASENFELNGYWFDRQVNLINAYNARDAYFLTGREMAVFVASPTVVVQDDAGQSYIYRFKMWRVYKRYNSEILYLDKSIQPNDQYNAILQFAPSTAGYYVIMPVYQRVFSVDIGTAVIDGALNKGGSIDLSYDKDSEEANMEGLVDRNLYLTDFYETVENGKTGYYYGQINGSIFLYFTGKFKTITDEETGEERTEPIFALNKNIFSFNYQPDIANLSTEEATLYFEIKRDGNNVTGFEPIRILRELKEGVRGVVPIWHEGGNDRYFYELASGITANLELEDEGFYLENHNDPVTFGELFNYAFNSYFYYDSITSNTSNRVSMPLCYDENTNEFSSLDLSSLTSLRQGNSSIKQNVNILTVLIYWNWYQNSHAFTNNDAVRKVLKAAGAYGLKSVAGVTIDRNMSEQYLLNITGLGSIFGGAVAHIVSNIQLNQIDTTSFEFKLSTYLPFTSLIKDTVGYSFSLLYSEMPTFVAHIEDGRKHSTHASLTDGELFADENGNVYPSQQFKSSYIDRDAEIILTPKPAIGYRLEGWYKCIFDEELGLWLTTDEKVTNSEYSYSDEIFRAYYNEYFRQYYYITPFYTQDATRGYIYYRDVSHNEPAVVPDSMLSRVRGFFIATGSKDDPNYIQVYRPNEASDYYYYDTAFTRVVEDQEVFEMTYEAAIKQIGDDYYVLNGIRIYKNVTEDGVLHYYRTRTQGNVVVDENYNLIIHSLHCNVRYVAKFIEIYNEYIYVEDEEYSGIKVEAVYYTSQDVEKNLEEPMHLRSSSIDGAYVNATDAYDYNAYGLDRSLFKLYDGDRASNFSEFLNKDFTYREGQSQRKDKPYVGADNYSSLLSGFGGKTSVYRVNADKDPSLDKSLVMKSMYFDPMTTVYIVVSVQSQYNLSIHSLGMNSNYVLEPILYPTDDFINYNQSARETDRVDYYYYIFRVTYDRDPENEYGSYIVHPTRGDSMSFDVLAGNYLDFYNKAGFVHYDNFGNKIDYDLGADINGLQTVNLDKYFDRLHLASDVLARVRGKNYENIQDGLNQLSLAMKQPGLYYVDHVTDSTSSTEYSDAFTIFNQIRQVRRDKDYQPPYLIKSGQQNFVNLSTIPIYSYTIQSMTIDQFEQEEDSTDFKYEENGKVILKKGATAHNLLNGLYAAIGTNGRTYLGTGEKEELEYSYKNHGDNGYYVGDTPFVFDTHYKGLPYGTDGRDHTLLEDFAFAENSVVLLDGTSAAENGYAFVGWYEQKYDRQTGLWSPMTIMSHDLEKPYLSLATSDTVIVALYKRVVQVEFTYDMSKITINFANNGLDSLGQPVTQSITGNMCSITGKFCFDTELQITVIPSGGYRFDGFNFVNKDASFATPIKLDLNNDHITYFDKDGNSDYDGTAYTYGDMRLNGVFGMSLPVKEIASLTDRLTNVKLEALTKKVNLVYIDIENYASSRGQNSEYTFNNVDFALYDLSDSASPKLLVETDGSKFDGYVDSILNLDGKDSTQYPICASLVGGHLALYGYFDDEMSGKLALITLQRAEEGATIFEWYINGCGQNTNDLAATFPGLNTDAYKGQKSGEFIINFEYSGDLVELNTNNYFELSTNNSAYYAKAIIETTQQVIFTHSYVDSVNDAFIAGTQFPENLGAISLLIFNGKRFLDNEEFEENGQITFDGTGVYTFSSNAILQIATKSQFISYNGSVYAFLGYFKTEYNYQQGVSEVEFVGTDAQSLVLSPTGVYEIKYVKIDKVTIDADGQGSMQINDQGNIRSGANSFSTTVFGYYEEGGYNYVLNGATLELDCYIIENYTYPTVTVTPSNPGPTLLTENHEGYIHVTISRIETDITISVLYQRGTRISISQRLYRTIDMTTDPEQANIGALTRIMMGQNSYGLSGTFALNTDISLSLLDSTKDYFYFIGWFKDGQLLSSEYTYNITVKEDMAVEARFTYYLNLSVRSLSLTSNTTVNGFSATVSYDDVRDGQKERAFTNSTSDLFRVPSGVKLHVVETRTNNLDRYFFNYWRNGKASNPRMLSDQKDAEIILNIDDGTRQSGSTYEIYRVEIQAIYSQVSTLHVTKNITISEDDKDQSNYYFGGQMTNAFKSLFDIVIIYTDAQNQQKTVSLSSDLEKDIVYISNTKLTIRISISSVVSDRYFVSSIVNYHGGQSERLDNALQLITLQYTAQSSSLTVDFVPSIQIQLMRELDGQVDNYDDIALSYSIRENAVESEDGTLTDATKNFNIQAADLSYSFTTSTENQRYIFVGWYINETLVSREATIDQDIYKITRNATIVARYITTVNLTIEREVDNEPSTMDLTIWAVGNIIENKGTNETPDTSVKLYSMNSDRSSMSLNLHLGGELVLAADHVSGYRFMGFTVYDNGTDISSNLLYVADTAKTVARLAVNTVSNLIVTAVYYKEYAISYKTTSFARDSVNISSTTPSGGSVVAPQYFYTSQENEINISVNTNAGYKVKAIFVNQEAIDISRSTYSYSFAVPEGKGDIMVDIRFVQETNINFYVAVNGSVDKSEINSKFGLDFNQIDAITVTQNNENTINVRFNNTNELRYNYYYGYINDNLNLSALRTLSGNGKTYYFQGWYVYNGQNVANSTYALSYNYNFDMTVSDDISLVAKYEEYENVSVFDDTEHYYTIYDSREEHYIDSRDISLSSSQEDRANQIYTIYGEKYMFVGYYTTIAFGNTIDELKLSNTYSTTQTAKYDGVVANVTARFVKLSQYTIDYRTANTFSLYSQVVTNYSGQDTSARLGLTNTSTKITSTSLAGSYVHNQYNAAAGHQVSSGSSFTVGTDVSTVAKVNIIGYNTVVECAAHVNNVTTTQNAADGAKSSVVLNSRATISTTFSITQTSSSKLVVTVYDPSTSTTQSFEVTASQSQTRQLVVGSVVNLYVELSADEQFLEYVIGGDNYRNILYNYTLPSDLSGSLTINAVIGTLYTLVVAENDENAGKVSISERGGLAGVNGYYSLTVNAYKNYAITDILVKSSTSDYVSLLNGGTGLESLAIVNTTIPTYSTFDSNLSNYVTSYTIELSLKANLMLKVVYKHVTTINFIIWTASMAEGSNNPTRAKSTYNLYIYEDKSPMTLDGLIEFLTELDNFNFLDKVGAIDRNAFAYNGQTFTSGTIEFATESYITIEYTTNIKAKMKVEIVINSDDATKYNIPTDGLNIKYGDKQVSSYNSSTEFECSWGSGTALFASDTNNYFVFKGYCYKRMGLAINNTNSQMLMIDPSIITSSIEIEDGVYVIYALFEEIINTLTLDANYDSSSFSITVNGTAVAPNNHYTDSALGNLYVNFDFDTMTYTITYPNSYVKANVKVSVSALNFEESTSDSTYLDALKLEKFYEKDTTDNNVRLRFYRFVDSDGNTLNTRYDTSAEIDLSKHVSDTVITAEAKRLYRVEFAYDYCSDDFTIGLYYIKTNNLTIDKTKIKESFNETDLDKAIITYWAEEGMILSAEVKIDNPDELVAGGYIFKGILGNYANAGVFNKNLLNKGYVFGTEPQLSGSQDWWKQKLELNRYPFVLATALISSANVSDNATLDKFIFYANAPISLLADFLSLGLTGKTDIFAVLANPEYDGTIKANYVQTGDSMVSQQGFVLGFVSEDALDVELTIEEKSNLIYHSDNLDGSYTKYQHTNLYLLGLDGLKELSLLNDRKVVYNNPRYGHVFYTYNFNKSAKDPASNIKQYIISIAVDRYVSLLFKTVKANKKFYTDDSMFTMLNLSRHAEIDNVRYEIRDNDNLRGPTKEINSSFIPRNTAVTLSADIKENYFFLGFILISASYYNNINVQDFDEQSHTTPITSYVFINNYRLLKDGRGNYYSAETTITLSNDTIVYALYEARVFSITVNQYQFMEDNEVMYDEDDPEGSEGISRMTKKEVQSANVKGDRLVEAYTPTLLTSVSHRYVQFAGWATEKEFTTSDERKIKIAYDSADPAHEFTDEGYEKWPGVYRLKYDDVYGLYDSSTGEFTGADQRNNLYIYDIDQDIIIDAYYSYISYRLIINITDVLGAYVYAPNGKGNDQMGDTYLTYADYIREAPNWENPSAGTYYYTYTNGSNKNNRANTNTQITIDKHDPYVYAINDVDGNLIYSSSEIDEYQEQKYVIPTRIQTSLISIEKSADRNNQVLSYISGEPVYIAYNNHTTYSKDQMKTVAFTAQNTNSYAKAKYKNNQKAFDLKFGTDGNVPASLYAYGFGDNQYEYYIGADNKLIPKVDNILRYIDTQPDEITGIDGPRLKANLFTLEIDGEKIDPKSFTEKGALQVDFSKGTIVIDYKVSATEYGFPTVRITQNNPLSNISGGEKVIYASGIETPGYVSTNQSEINVQTATQVNGFYTDYIDQLEDSDQPLTLLPDVNVLLKYFQFAYTLEASVKVGDNSVVNLTKNADLNKLKISNNNGADCIDLLNQYEITNAYIIIMENGGYLLNLLLDIVDILEANPTKGTKNDLELAKVLRIMLTESSIIKDVGEDGKIVGLAPTGDRSSNNDLGGKRRGEDYLSACQDVWKDYSKLDTYQEAMADLLYRYFNIDFGTGQEAQNNINNFFHYTVIDVFNLCRNGVDVNSYHAFFHADDLVFYHYVLSEHHQKQVNHPKDAKVVWRAEKGYDYFIKATLEWNLSYENAGFNGISTSNNTFAYSDEDQGTCNKLPFGKVLRNYFGGLFNGALKYLGSFRRLIRGMMCLDGESLAKQGSNKITLQLKLDPRVRIRSNEHRYSPWPVLNAVGGIILVGSTWYLYVAEMISLVFKTDRDFLDILVNLF